MAEEEPATRKTTAEFLGKGQKKLGGKECQQRRAAILDRYAKLGDKLPPNERPNFAWFKSEWDRVCREKYGNDWPDNFLHKLQGVLNTLKTDRAAFVNFVFDQQRKYLGGIRALLVPHSMKSMPAITAD